MPLFRLTSTVGVALALAACAGRQPDSVPSPLAGPRWAAVLLPLGTTIDGSAAVSPASNNQTMAVASITGARAGAEHPWHIHQGRCGSNGPIVGPMTAYPPFRVRADGTAQAAASLPMPTPASGNYYVNVHLSAAEMGTIVACGNLERTGGGDA